MSEQKRISFWNLFFCAILTEMRRKKEWKRHSPKQKNIIEIILLLISWTNVSNALNILLHPVPFIYMPTVCSPSHFFFHSFCFRPPPVSVSIQHAVWFWNRWIESRAHHILQQAQYVFFYVVVIMQVILEKRF